MNIDNIDILKVSLMSKPIKIEIQICSNCKSHEWCTRHKEANYSSLAAEISKAIKDHNNDIDV